MTSIQFYHLTTSPLERALPKLMEKAYDSGQKTLLIASSEARVNELSKLLWSYEPGSFLPHGSVKDSHSEDQPILISTDIDPVNGATILLVTDGATPENPDLFGRILDMFDGNDPDSVARARQRWTLYKNAGHEISYMKQNASGGWQKAA